MAGDAGDESSPLLGSGTCQRCHQPLCPDPQPSSAKSSIRSGHSSDGKSKATTFQLSSESTPLLAHRGSEGIRYMEDRDDSYPPSREPSPDPSSKKGKKWIARPSSIALIGLIVAVLTVLGVGFASPTIVKQYGGQAAVYETTGLSIESFTADGLQARVQGSFLLDASRVASGPLRDFGRLGTWLAKEIESDRAEVQVSLPEYGNVLLGTATLPPIKVNIRNGHMNKIDFVTDVKAGDVAGVRVVANDWLQGRLGQLRVKGVASVPLRSGIFYLGSQAISGSFVFQDKGLHGSPKLNITKLDLHEGKAPNHEKAMVADISVQAMNRYPISLAVPPMGFRILVPNCSPTDDYIRVANATTDLIQVVPNNTVTISAKGFIGKLPDALTTICPGTNSSPLDLLVERFIQGLESMVYVRGGKPPSPTLPNWIEGFLKNVTIPVPFSGHALGQLVRNFSMTDVHFSLPEPFAEPDTPEVKPKISALVKAIIDLPKEMNFALNIPHVRSTAKIYHKGRELGFIDVRKWQNANATRIEDGTPPSSALLVEFDIQKAPLQVTDEDTFTDVVQALIFQREPVPLYVQATVDAETDTALGQFVIRDIPASGNITVKPPASGGFADLKIGLGALEILRTTESSILLDASLNFTNPTNYSANVPYVNLKMAYNGTNVGDVTARNLSIYPGFNSDIKISGLWDPLRLGGKDGVAAGQDLLSHYISGLNTSIVLKSHKGMLPSLPKLGSALSKLELDIPVPKLRAPGNGDQNPGGDGQSHFIKDATLHLWSSTAVFTLVSPLTSTTLLITSINAAAFYNHSEPVGKIKYDLPFAVPPGVSQTPRLPVDLDLTGAGYEAIRQALGGTLKMDAVADVGVQLGEYSNTVFYKGKGIGAKVRI
ncbi:hypothetical protein AJ79_07261 [Helicocarpus griseus UAMH5409]|uniref:Pre-rRNA processing protein n=1 Tax=Helicocarpus griseus UAMH5409 TaxID=1447875 RepID=A0A2B7X4B0_9EURO|nr:hypothetical protein AJ79_07261 [Helicocarpus griseus UAMH5409]